MLPAPASIDNRSADRTAHAVRSVWATILCLGTFLAVLPTQALAAKPQIATTSFSAVTESSVALEAKVDTLGAKVEYHFDYISRAAYEANGNSFGPTPAEAPVPFGQLPGHPEAKGDLAAGSPVVTNLSLVSGALDAGQTITGTGVPGGTTIATLDLEHHQLTLSKPVEAGKSTAGAKLLASGPQPVSTQITGLEPATAYLYRAVAVNGKSEEETGPALAFFTLAALPVFGPCPNDAFRGGSFAPPGAPSAALPDCRVYEQASPVDKGGGDVLAVQGLNRAADQGAAISYFSSFGMPGGVGAEGPPLFSGRRGSDEAGWLHEGLMPPPSFGQLAVVDGFSPGLSHTYATVTRIGEPREKALIEQSGGGASPTVIAPYAPNGGLNYGYAGASADQAVVVLEAETRLPAKEGNTPIVAAIPNHPNVYAWGRSSGELHLASVMNDLSSPPGGAFAGPYSFSGGTSGETLKRGGAADGYYLQDTHAITSSGDVYFTAAGTGQLYERLNATQPQSSLIHPGEPGEECTEAAQACTIHVSASKRSAPDPGGPQPAAFQAASADGSVAYFTSSEKLTGDANTGPEQPPAQIGRATLGGAVEPEDLREGFLHSNATGLALSPDGSYVYWVNPVAKAIGRAKINSVTGEAELPEPEFIVPGESKAEIHPEAEPGVFASAPSTPQSVAVGPCDGGGECVYWTNTGPLGGEEFGGKKLLEVILARGGTIGRAKIDPPTGELEGDPEPEWVTGASNPNGIAVNDEHVYWVNGPTPHGGTFTNQNSISRVDLLGSGRVQLLQENVGNTDRIQGLAMSPTHIYFTVIGGQGPNSHVESMPLEGGEPDGFLPIGQDEAAFLAVDGSHLYWSVNNAVEGDGESTPKHSSVIGRAAFADIASKILPKICSQLPACQIEFIVSDGTLGGVAVDPTGHHLYWSVNGEAPGNLGNDLYRFTTAGETLEDLTVSPAPNGAEVQGVLGASRDGSYLYFTANADLDGVGPAEAGSCQTSVPHGPIESTKGSCWAYLYHAGTITAVAGLSGTDNPDWIGSPFHGTASYTPKAAFVSPDGQVLLFRSREKLSGYENEGTPQLYRFEAGQPGITCVSCLPSGSSGSFEPTLETKDFFGSAIKPGPIGRAMVEARNLSDDGKRAYFETGEALVGGDTNGQGGCPGLLPGGGGPPRCQDVYEWEAPEAGSCETGGPGYSPLNEGCLYLISSGKSPYPSFFLDASETGEDVFFLTRQSLVRQDEDEIQDVYDARGGGGLAAQNQLAKSTCEGLEGCRDSYQEPVGQPGPGSAGFTGPPNSPQKPPRQFPRHRKKHHKNKKHQKHQKRHQRKALQ